MSKTEIENLKTLKSSQESTQKETTNVKGKKKADSISDISNSFQSTCKKAYSMQIIDILNTISAA
jgi:hypothetical protein